MTRLLPHILTLLLLFSTCHAGATDRLVPFLADSASNTRIAVIVCPGGSYSWLDKENEGSLVARWLQSNGINAFVLNYRVASVAAYVTGFRVLGIGHKYPDMLIDVQNALRYLHQHSAQLNIDPSRIGVMGFSAGGHLAFMSHAMNHTLFRPSFLALIYPVVTMNGPYAHVRSRRGALGVWGQWNQTMRDSLSLERHIPLDCPPLFLLNCLDDKTVHPRNSIILDSALSANHIPHTYIQYPTGGHGFGVSRFQPNSNSRHWTTAFLLWLHKTFCIKPQ